ncbi:MAG: urea ABC transporter permease subunit UrtB [Desulfobulbaceae bacterium]|nr:urea ABC transporter permease subunit UrtB [Desulfobulbaceae bacterium]
MCLSPKSTRCYRILLILTLLSFLPFAALCHAEGSEVQFQEGINLLTQKDFTKKEAAIEKIAESGDKRAEAVLRALLEGTLFRVKKDNSIVYGSKEGSKITITSILTGEELGSVKKRKAKKITINNALRTQIKNELAKIELSNPDAKVRLDAVNKLMPTLTIESSDLLANLLKKETNSEVSDALKASIAIIGLRSPEKEKRLLSLTELKGNLNPAVRNELNRLINEEQDKAVLHKAKSALSTIESKIAFFGLVEKGFFGLSLGSVLVLAAIGLAITFGVIGVINMAHGELIMLGAYTTYVIQQLLPDSIGLALFLSIPAAFLVSGLAGIVIERSVIRFLYGRPLETLLATFGISLILQQAVRSIFSPLNRSVSTPAWMSGSLQLNPILSLTTNRITILVFSLLVFAGLYMLLKKSSIGLQVRAVSQNRAMAKAMGVRAARVDALTFGLGSGIAGIAGVALSQLTNVGPNLGQAYIIDSFMVVVFGGVGNLWGTLLGGLSLGVANKFLEPWAGAVLAKILILVFIILFIQKRPQGLFPQKGRAAG